MGRFDEFHERELLELSRMLAARELSAVELTTAYLERITMIDPALHSFSHLTAELAVAQADRADRERSDGRVRGPLQGIPIVVKDNIDVQGAPTAAGMPMRRGHEALHDATVVRRLAAAGAVILGKTTLTEGVYAEYRPPYEAPVNPWSANHWAGASSSGSGVAVAAGLCAGALGSDSGASIRLPSAANGITGIRPTLGRVSRHGVFELAATLDQVGPMARSAADTAVLLQAIAGPDPDDPTTHPDSAPDYLAGAGGLAGIRLGVDPGYALSGVDEHTSGALHSMVGAFAELGVQVREIRFPDPNQIIADWFGVCAAQAALAHQATFPSRRDEYGPALTDLLDRGNRMRATEYQDLLLRRDDFRGHVARVFADVDLVLLPVLPFVTPRAQEMVRMDERHIAGVHRFTCPFPMSGSPTITLPAGFADGLPIGMQLVGRQLGEGTLIRAGRAYQRVTDWHRRRPAV